MALNLNAVSEAVKRTTNVPDENSDFTQLYWFRITADTVDCVIAYVGDDPAINYLTYMLAFVTTGQQLHFDVNLNTGSPSTVNVGAITTNRWIPVAYTRSGSTHSFYYNGTTVGSVVKDWSTSATPVNNIWLGNDTGTGDSNKQFFGYREYDRALTLTEIIAEWNSNVPIDTDDLVADCPLLNDPDDDSGNNNDFTEIGSVTYVSQPTQVSTDNTGNTGGTNAYDIGSLPSPGSIVSFVEVVRVGLTTPSAWFKYTPAAIPANVVFGMYWLGANYGTIQYLPILNVYTGVPPVSSIYKTISNFSKRPMEIPVDSVQTYYIRMVANGGNPSPAVLYIEFYNAPDPVTAPAGSILINDAVAGFQAGLFDPDTMELLQFRAPIAGGDDGYKLPSGSVILEDRADLTSKIYDSQLNYVATVPYYTDELLSGNKGTKFAVGQVGSGGADSFVHLLNEDGSLSSSINIGPVTGIHQMTLDEVISTIYIVQTRLNGSIIKYNGVTGTIIGVFVSGVPGFNTGELLWLNGNFLAVGYYSNTSGTDSFVRIYDCDDASIVSQTTLADSGIIPSLGSRAQLHLSDPFPNANPQEILKVWYKHSTPTGNCKSRFIEIEVSTGNILSSVDRDNFFAGAYQCDFLDPQARFGHSASCNFYTTTEEIPPPGEPGEPGTLIVVKEVTGGGGPTFNFTGTGPGVDPEFSLGDGDDITFSDLTPNNGYGVEEIPVNGYSITYHVSNGSPHDNISIGPGETVTVTVTNAPAGRVTVRKLTVNSLSTLTFLFTLEGNGIPTSTVQLANGEEHTFENIPVGEGYTLSETQLAPGWEITSVVINGSPTPVSDPIIIDVEPDTETLVIVTNTFTATAGSGIYKIQPEKTNDTLWVDLTTGETFTRKIPDPTVRGPLLGD